MAKQFFYKQNEALLKKDYFIPRDSEVCWVFEIVNYYSGFINSMVDNNTFRGSSSIVTGFFTMVRIPLNFHSIPLTTSCGLAKERTDDSCSNFVVSSAKWRKQIGNCFFRSLRKWRGEKRFDGDKHVTSRTLTKPRRNFAQPRKVVEPFSSF